MGTGQEPQVSQKRFNDRLDQLLPEPPKAIAVACSGGADSLALVLLMRDWALARRLVLNPVVVDHGLRDGSDEEAQYVSELLVSLGLEPRILTNRGPRPRRNVQAAARAIRFGLIGEWMRGEGLTYLALGHHQDDQAETLLMRLARGSGVDGLSAMSAISTLDGLTVVRPLLSASKDALRDVVRRAGLKAVEDPSNGNTAHTRVRVRNARKILAREGLSAERLAATAARMARARMALDAARDQFLMTHVTQHPAGFATLAPEALGALPEEIALRVLGGLSRTIGGRVHPAREEKIVGLYRALQDRSLAGGRTVNGCRVLPWRAHLLMCRETSAVGPSIPAADGAIWDNRFVCRMSRSVEDPGLLRSTQADETTRVGKLGNAGIRLARKEGMGSILETVPGAVRPSLPAVWKGRHLISIPPLDALENQPEGLRLTFLGQGPPW